MTKPTDQWMPLYVGDYIADTTRFSTECHGAYLLMLMDYWRNGPLPDNDDALAAIVRMPVRRWKKIREIIAEKFQITDGKWRHKRVDIELGRATTINAVRAKAGRLGGETTQANRKAKLEQGHKQTTKQTGTPLPSQSPLPNPVPDEQVIHSPLKDAAFAGFIQRCGLPAAYVAKELNAIYDEFGERAFWDSFEKLKTLEARRPLGFLRKLASGHKEAAA